MEEDIQVEDEKPEEKMATLATEEVEPNENEDELREADEKICDEKRSKAGTRGTLYELDQVFTKYSQFTGEPSSAMSKSESTGPITALFNQRWGVADFADLDFNITLSPLEKTFSLPGYGRREVATNNNNDTEIDLIEPETKSSMSSLKRSKIEKAEENMLSMERSIA